ncbi:MAG: hypothetical protein ACE5GB_07630, partial [Acidimicrobiales bacterium]
MLGLVGSAAPLAGAVGGPSRPGQDEALGVVDVVQVSGFLDGINAEFIERAITNAEQGGSIALVLQVNSTRSVVSDERLVELAVRITTSAVPVSMWIGPSGSKAEGGVAQLAGVVTDLAVAPGSRLGKLGEQVLPEDRFGVLFGVSHERLVDDTIGFEDAIELGLAREAPVLGLFVSDLEGFVSEIDDSGERPVRRPVTPVRFNKLALADQLLDPPAERLNARR